MLENILIKGADELGVSLPAGALGAFKTYYEFLEEKNRVMNLTAISGEEDTAKLHFLDCLSLLKMADFSGKSVIDIGSGAGFPGLPLKIAEESISLTALDALQKRIGFLNELCEKMGIESNCVHARAEEAALKPEMRESFDFAVSRAVSRLNILSELCLPFVKTGGMLVAMKSVGSEEEINEAKSALKILGAQIEKVVDYQIPDTDIMHRAVLIRKTGTTPKGYPRRFAKIQKNPL